MPWTDPVGDVLGFGQVQKNQHEEPLELEIPAVLASHPEPPEFAQPG
jgi:hypothetical protein